MSRACHSLNLHLGRTVLGAATLAALVGSAAPAVADTLPLCDQPSSLITCAEADVGKPCQGGGMCYAMPCANIGAQNGVVYKCDACPTLLPLPDGGCSPSNLGTPCSDGGTCRGINSYCGATTKFVCSIPATDVPTGPPAGETGGGGASGGSSGAGAGGGGSSGGTGSGGSGTGGSTGGATGGGANGGSVGGGTKTVSSGGGCEVVPGVPTMAGIVAVVLIAVGLILVAIGRRRRGARP
jgi:hypothetical protein